MISEFIYITFYTLQNTKKFHWQTENYAQHKALDGFYESFFDLSDKFLEIYLGKFGRNELSYSDNIELINYVGTDLLQFYKNIYNELLTLFKNMNLGSDLRNVSEEILGEISKLSYLLTLT